MHKCCTIITDWKLINSYNSMKAFKYIGVGLYPSIMETFNFPPPKVEPSFVCIIYCVANKQGTSEVTLKILYHSNPCTLPCEKNLEANAYFIKQFNPNLKKLKHNFLGSIMTVIIFHQYGRLVFQKTYILWMWIFYVTSLLWKP